MPRVRRSCPLTDEERVVTFSRAAGTLAYPASFVLVAAMNLCPCGCFGDAAKPRGCSMGIMYFELPFHRVPGNSV